MTGGRTEEPTRVLIADDHPLFRDGLKVALDTDDEVTVVGEAATGTEAVELASRLQPDVVLMDVNMPGLNGIEATRRIVGESPHIGVVMLTMFDEDENVFQAMRAGARGYLLKGADQAAILRAVTAVARGEAIFGRALATRLIGYFAAAPLFGSLGDRLPRKGLIAAGVLVWSAATFASNSSCVICPALSLAVSSSNVPWLCRRDSMMTSF